VKMFVMTETVITINMITEKMITDGISTLAMIMTGTEETMHGRIIQILEEMIPAVVIAIKRDEKSPLAADFFYR